MYSNSFDKRKSGISLIGDIPWGTSLCQFYQKREDILDILLPYIKAGLENNEFCVWVTSDELREEDVKKALCRVVPDLPGLIQKGQLEIIHYSHWHTGSSKSEKQILDKLNTALSCGFEGLRLALNYPPLVRGGKSVASKREIEAISRGNATAIYAYSRDEFDAVGLMEMVKNFQFTLIRHSDKWEIMESSEARFVKDALTRSEEKLRSLFSNMAEGFAYHQIILDTRGVPCDYIFLEVNAAFEKLLHLNSGNIIGKRVTEVLPGTEKDPSDWIGKYGKVALTGKPVHFESYSEVLCKWYSVSAFSPHKGFFAVTFTDITDRKTAEENLKVNNERLKILSEANSLLLSSDTPEKIVQTIAFKVMTHLKCDCFFNFIADQKAGKLRLNAFSGIAPEVAKGIEWLNYGEAICGCAARDGCRIVSENIQENGDMRATLVRSFGVQAYAAHPLTIGLNTIGTLSFGTRSRISFTEEELDLMKTIAGQVSVAMERKQAEEVLKQRTLELEASNRELESFSYSVSHDLRSPLRSMDGFSQAILEDYADKLDDQGKQWLNNIRSSSQKMARLIDDILSLSRVVRAELRIQEVNLSELADSVVRDLLSNQTERKIIFSITPGLRVFGDANLLRIALTNLLGNAFKFTSKSLNPRIEFGAAELDGQNYYFVRDNGAGFDMAYSHKLFNAFQRLHSTEEFPGTGIGLATVQRIIQRHGGRILARGEIGKGATFYFTLGQADK